MMRRLDSEARRRKSAGAVGLGLLLFWAPVLLWACGGNDAEGSSCAVGSESCPCTAGGACDGDLECLSNVCVDTSEIGSGGSSSGSGGSSSSSATTDSGSGGVLNRGGSTSTSSASSTTSTVPENPSFALPCTEDADCGDDLICVTAESSSLGIGGPANGLCTEPCTDSCPDPATACVNFAGNGSYCMPQCGLADGVIDCQGRPDMVCDVLQGGTGIECTTDADCAQGSCLDSECLVPLSLCLPRCGADSDCPSGRFCDPGSGECVDDEPAGLGLDESCDPAASTDECRGFCGTTSMTCVETCTFGAFPTCGSDDPTFATAECFPVLDGTDLGDIGVCVRLCDCSSECGGGLPCVSFESPTIGQPPLRGRAGFCVEELADDILLTCD